MNASEAVAESGLLDTLMSADLADRIQADEASGRGSWGWDPDVDGVVGFTVEREVVVILYLEHEDFENNDLYADGLL